MKDTLMNVEDNITLACLNPNEKLNIPSYTTDADHRCLFGFTLDGYVGIGIPATTKELHIYKNNNIMEKEIKYFKLSLCSYIENIIEKIHELETTEALIQEIEKYRDILKKAREL